MYFFWFVAISDCAKQLEWNVKWKPTEIPSPVMRITNRSFNFLKNDFMRHRWSIKDEMYVLHKKSTKSIKLTRNAQSTEKKTYVLLHFVFESGTKSVCHISKPIWVVHILRPSIYNFGTIKKCKNLPRFSRKYHGSHGVEKGPFKFSFKRTISQEKLYINPIQYILW